MNTPILTDRLRAYLDGALDERGRADIERDPALVERVRTMQAAFAGTDALDAAAPAPRTTFEALAMRRAREDRRRFVRRAAAAAVLAFAIGWCAWRALGPVDAGVVELETLPLELHDVAEPPRVPELLADYAPVRDGRVQFLRSLDDARAVAAAVGRPVLLFGFVEGCPWCSELQGGPFLDPRFQALAERTVPVAIDLLAVDDALSAPLFERGYPVLELQDASGATELVLSGPPGTVDLVRGLTRGLERSEQGKPALAWTEANDLARKLVSSSFAERQGRLSTAWTLFDELARRGGELALGAQGRAGLARIAADARRELADALARSETDVRTAGRALEALEERCAGTPLQRDVRSVLDALRASGRAPELRAHGS